MPRASCSVPTKSRCGGAEARFGVVRGSVIGGDWGLSFVDKSIDEDSTLNVDTSSCFGEQCGTFYRTLAHTRRIGLEFCQFQLGQLLTTFGRRAF